MKIPNRTARLRAESGSWLLLLLSIAVAAHLLIENASAGSPVRRLIESTFQGRPAAAAEAWAPIDDLLRRLPSDGNLLLRFVGFERDDPGWQQYASFIYYRAVYLLHPRTVTLAPPDQTVNDGRQVLAVDFRPDSAWVARRRILYLLQFRREGGQVLIDVLPATSNGLPPGGRP
jgi:hypothetical protein